MALRRIYDDANFTLPAVTDAVIDGSLTVESKSEIAPSTANLIVSATGFATEDSVAQITERTEGAGGGDVFGVIATRFLAGTNYGVSINASSASSAPSNQLVVSTNGCVGIGVPPVNAEPGSLEVSGSLVVPAIVGEVTVNGTASITVANPLTTTISKVFFALKTAGGTIGVPLVAARVAGTSFDVRSQMDDTSTYDYILIG